MIALSRKLTALALGLSFAVGSSLLPSAAEAQTRDYDVLLNWTGPVHFIWGGLDDVFTEAWGRQWAASYPQATFDLLPDAGHFPQETHGAEIARLFQERVAVGR